MLKVFEAQNPAEAHLVMGLLQTEGIHADVRGESLFTTVEGASAATGMRPSVWIADDRQKIPAMAIISNYSKVEGSLFPSSTSWHCPNCGETHEPQFTSCWKCGTPFPVHPEHAT